MIPLRFVRGYGVASAAIAWMGSGRFSHVDYLMRDGSLLGSRSDRLAHRPPGVQVRPFNYNRWKDSATLAIPSNEAQEKRMLDFLRAQIGKPYDHSAIWGFALGRDWRDDESWFCSELQTAALEYAGVIPELFTPSSKISPTCLCTLASAIGARLQ
jgi:hypothetical protein